MPVDLNKYVIELALRGRLGRPFRYFDAIGSTNSAALDWSREGAPHGAMVVADHQEQGRGRGGRGWFSEAGKALQLSLILRPVVPLDVFGLISTALSLACAETIEEVTGLPAAIKWPNDVTLGGRKLAGILVETRVTGHQVDVAVAGMGINVLPPERWPEGLAATSIGEEIATRGGETQIDRTELLAALLVKVENVYGLVETGRGAAEVLARASARSEILGDEVLVHRHGDAEPIRGIATRLLPSGALELAAGGSYVTVPVGQVEHLRPVPGGRRRHDRAPDSSTVDGVAQPHEREGGRSR